MTDIGVELLLADLVARFSKALLEKLCDAQAKGRRGWDNNDWEDDCRRGLLKHLAKGDPRDVAAYCAFMWHHGWATNAGPAATPTTGDPLVGLDERLDRLCLTEKDTNNRFILSTESAKNIVGIVREWLRVKGGPAATPTRLAAIEECAKIVDGYGASVDFIAESIRALVSRPEPAATPARDVTEAMALAGARSIGNTIHTDNHMVRARECWRAMWDARDGIVEPIPQGTLVSRPTRGGT